MDRHPSQRNTDWQRIGRVRFTEAICSYNADHVIQFRHPGWRENPNSPSTAIRSGTNPNQLEIRIKGSELSFYVNGQYLTRISDTENFQRGRVGLYTSDTAEIAFDDLEITR